MSVCKLFQNGNGGIFDKVIWINICKFVKDFDTFIALSQCSKLLFFASRHGGAGNVRWNLTDSKLLHKMLDSDFKKAVTTIKVCVLSAHTAAVLSGLQIDSLYIEIPDSSSTFGLTIGSLYQDGINLKQLLIERTENVEKSAEIRINMLPEKLEHLSIKVPESKREDCCGHISVNVPFPDTLKKLSLHCPIIRYAGIINLPVHITKFVFKDKHAYVNAPTIHSEIEELTIVGEEEEVDNHVIEEDIVYSKLKWLKLANRNNSIDENRVIHLSNIPNIKRLCLFNGYIDNDIGLNMIKSAKTLDGTIYYKFGERKNNKKMKL